METTHYGPGGAEFNEFGQFCEPKQVITKNEPWGHLSRTGTRALPAGLVRYLVQEYRRLHGALPSRVVTPDPVAMKAIGVGIPGHGPLTLDILHDPAAPVARVE